MGECACGCEGQPQLKLHATGAVPLSMVDFCLQVQASTALAGVDNTAKSLLLFDGAAEVQGLFDFLLNEATRICGSDCDVPQLLAPVAFPGACLKQHSVRVGTVLLWALCTQFMATSSTCPHPLTGL